VAVGFIGGGTRRKPLVTEKLYHIIVVSSCTLPKLPQTGFEPTTLVVIGTDCIGSCKSNYHTIMTTTAPLKKEGMGYGV
jgi:hypothetical protein